LDYAQQAAAVEGAAHDIEHVMQNILLLQLPARKEHEDYAR
jgi:hypothetical protein